MNKDFDDDSYYKNRSKKGKKSRGDSSNNMKGKSFRPKTKPKAGDYHLIAKQMRGQKKSTEWYSKVENAK